MVRHPRDSAAPPKSRQDKKPASADKLKRLSASKPGAKGSGVGDKGGIRIAKAMARAGVASRREIERLIGLGKVAVNGRILDSAATLVRPDDILTLDGQVVGGPEPARLWRYHKPVGLLTTNSDPEGRPTVFQHLPEGLPRVISVGRLDFNTEGLLLLTNDGDLARALELPSTGWVRRYRARAHGSTTQARLDGLKDGVEIEGVRYGPVEAKLDKAQGANVWITVSISEGKNREVRRVLESLGLKVNRLIRLSYGPFTLGTLGSEEVEEVGPRVIREQLAEFLKPETLPTGDRVSTPLAKNTRRLATGPRRAREGVADPTRKPSRVRAEAEAPEADVAEARPARRAAPPPRSTGRGGPPRGDDRRAGGGFGRSASRGPRSDDAGRPGPRRSAEDGDRPFKARGPRPEGGAGRPFAGGPRSGPRRDAEGGDRPFRPRGPRAEGAGERRFEGGPRSAPRRAEGEGDRPFKPRGPRAASGDRAERSDKPYARKGPPRRDFADRADGERPRGPRPPARTARGDGPPRGDAPRGPRAGAGGKPVGAKFGPRPGGSRPGGKPGGAPRSGPPRGGKPGGKPGGPRRG